ncbi:hypothetical protein AOLI_G00170040 [Acnodon oligacanthus]
MSFFKVVSPGPAAEGRCGDPDGRWRPPTDSSTQPAPATLVEVKLQHKSLYNGLESEHWWVLSNSFITCPHWSFLPSISPVPVLWPASSALDPSER